MAKPLRSDILDPPNPQFSHFGVLDTGGQNKSAFFGSIVFNLVLALIAIIIGASVKKTLDVRNKTLTLTVPLAEKPPEPPKPKVPPPPKLPPPPKPIETPEPPKIKLPDVKIPDPPKPIPVVAPKPIPIITPAAPKIEKAAAAPTVTKINLAQSAALKNNETAAPKAVALGMQNSPVPLTAGPAVSPVRLNNGMSGMPPGNSGVGAPSKVNLGGSGQPTGSLGGTSVVAVSGIPRGIRGGTGTNGNGTGTQAPQTVSLGGAPPPLPQATRVAAPVVRTAPQVLFKPKPAYTADATSQHIEGTVSVKIKVSATGSVTVLGLQNSLGHGLDESARQCAQGIRFKPAVDASGNPIDWEGVVSITFQMA